jgi:hypothetical protein
MHTSRAAILAVKYSARFKIQSIESEKEMPFQRPTKMEALEDGVYMVQIDNPIEGKDKFGHDQTTLTMQVLDDDGELTQTRSAL